MLCAAAEITCEMKLIPMASVFSFAYNPATVVAKTAEKWRTGVHEQNIMCTLYTVQ